MVSVVVVIYCKSNPECDDSARVLISHSVATEMANESIMCVCVYEYTGLVYYLLQRGIQTPSHSLSISDIFSRNIVSSPRQD